MDMGSRDTKVSGGGSATSVADLPSDWQQRMGEELRLALKEEIAEEELDPEKTKIVKLELLVKNGIVYNKGGWRIGKLD